MQVSPGKPLIIFKGLIISKGLIVSKDLVVSKDQGSPRDVVRAGFDRWTAGMGVHAGVR